MLCIFQGKKRIRNSNGVILSEGRNAGTIQAEIQTKIGQCEHTPTIQHKKEGRNVLTLKKETIGEATERIRKEHTEKHLSFDPATVQALDLKTSIVGEVLSASPREIFISPDLKKDDGSLVTIADFPDGHSFGNGITANSKVRLKDGSERYFTWCILPEGTSLTQAQKDLLRSVCEK